MRGLGCALLAYTRKNGRGSVELLQIEGDPDSPITEGRLCLKSASAMELAISKRRLQGPLYRAPGAGEFKRVSWDFALDKLARDIKASRDRTFATRDEEGNVVCRRKQRVVATRFARGAAPASLVRAASRRATRTPAIASRSCA